MKSPWKFLVGLTRRTEKDDWPGVPSSSENPQSLDHEKPLALASVIDKAPPSHVEDGGVPVSAPFDEPEHIDDLETLAAIAVASAEGKEKFPATKKQRKRSHNGAGGRRRRQRPTTAEPLNQFDDARTLDDEIAQLRLELRRKLELQNAQLRQMLERFVR